MKDMPYYTLHLESHMRSDSPEKPFYPKVTQLHHYPEVDFAFLGLLQLEAAQLDRRVVMDGKLSRHISSAYVTPPRHDQAIAEIVQVDLPTKEGDIRPHLAIRQAQSAILSREIVTGLKGMGVENPLASQLPIAHYSQDGKLIDHYNAQRKLEHAIRFHFRQRYFVAHTNQEKMDPTNMIPFSGDVTQEFTYAHSMGIALYHLLQVDMSSFNHMVVRNKGLDHLTHSANVFAPYEDPRVFELIDYYHSGSGPGLLDHDGVFLKISEANNKMIAHYAPEIVLLPHGGISAVRSVATYNNQLTEVKVLPAVQAILQAIPQTLGEEERKRLVRKRSQPDGAGKTTPKL